MKILNLIASVFIFSCLVQSQDKAIDLGWMAGCWQMTNGKSVTDEQWMKPSGGMMLGISRMVKDGKASFFENMRFVEKDGSLFFVARPSMAKSDTFFKFKSASFSVKTSAKFEQWTFENPEHDFPQRVIYRNAGKNEMFARIEGKINGKDEGEDFRYKRVKCE